MSALLILCTCPADVATCLAETLVGERLAACVNRVDGLASTYRWQGQVRTDPETLLIAKTTSAAWPALRERLHQLHPYELPEILALDIRDGLPAYLAWVAAETREAGA